MGAAALIETGKYTNSMIMSNKKEMRQGTIQGTRARD
jgi:hypothetical protein